MLQPDRQMRRWSSVLPALLLLLSLFDSALAEVSESGTVFRDCAKCPEMVVVPNGRTGTGTDQEMVEIKPFAISRFAVTFDEWDACVADHACAGSKDDHGWGRGRRPVINVSWRDAMTYARWLSTVTGVTYGLPTESEWEYAARGGTTTDYWWGNSIGSGFANCRDCGGQWAGTSTAPVGSFPSNPFGLYDMNGNVWQWTADCWSSPATPGKTENECRNRVIRGGSWYYYSPMAKSSARARFDAGLWSYSIGIRVVHSLR